MKSFSDKNQTRAFVRRIFQRDDHVKFYYSLSGAYTKLEFNVHVHIPLRKKELHLRIQSRSRGAGEVTNFSGKTAESSTCDKKKNPESRVSQSEAKILQYLLLFSLLLLVSFTVYGLRSFLYIYCTNLM